MKKKWIYIEPFVFIWQDDKYYLFYNSLNGKKVFVHKNETIDPIVQSFLIEENAYSALVAVNVENEKDFVDFLNALKSNQLGNMVAGRDIERPVNVPPKLILNRAVDNSKKEAEYFEDDPIENIDELTIQVNGDCDLNCTNCGEFHLQLVHCVKSGHSLSKQKIKNLVRQVRHLPLQKINITGGDILSSGNFEFIVNIFSTVRVAKIYNIHYRQIDPDKVQYILDKDKTSFVRVSVHCNEINETELIKQITFMERSNLRILWSFVVSSEDELNLYYSVLERCKSIHDEVKPFYNKENEDFIREYVFVSHDDVEEINPSKKQIFANQIINRNYFGKMTIQADEQVFDNVNFNAVGTLDGYLDDMVLKVIRDGNSWRWIRSNEVCDGCLYKLICPPPSNLELVMKSKIMCQIPRSYEIV